MPDYRSTRRRVLASLAATGLGGLAGCQGDAPPPETSTPPETSASPTTAAPPAREVQTQPTWTTGEQYGALTVPDHGSDDPSRVWFTLTEGALAQARFPRVDGLAVRTLDFVVADGDGYVARTHDAARATDDGLDRTVTAADDVPRYRGEVSDPDAGWTLTWEAVPAPDHDALVLDAAFDADREFDVYAVCEPACGGSAGGNVASRVDDGEGYAFTVTDTGDADPVFRGADGDPFGVAAGLAAAGGFSWATVDTIEGESRTTLLGDGVATDAARSAEGVVTLAGRVLSGATGSATLALGFSEDHDEAAALETARAALGDGFAATRDAYASAWTTYLDDLGLPESVADDPALASQYRHAVAALVTADDKTIPGAGIASPSVPWGSGVGSATPDDYGYNFVWARDLYQAFTAFLAAGDVTRARKATEYVFAYQQSDTGYVAQNTFVDGRVRWSGEQLDEVAFPLVMAYQLRARHDLTFDDVDFDYADVAASAHYVAANGPSTGQERWEEEGGYSPSTIAAEIAGLAAAASLAAAEGHREDALLFLGTADAWQRQVDDWTVTTTGAAGHDPPYYVRVTANGDPDAGLTRALANGGPTLDERAIVDAGFLELVRLGVKPHDDDYVTASLDVVDDAIRVDTPNGPAWYRYNGDGYGEGAIGSDDPGAPYTIATETRGRLWPILTGERAEYELRAGTTSGALAPRTLLRAMADFANSGRMIPEQVWDRPDPTAYGWTFGEGTGSATPLSWSMAQFVRLAHGLDAGTPVETPAFVFERYVDGGGPPAAPALSVSWPDAVVHERDVVIRGKTDASEVRVVAPGGTTTIDVTDGAFETTVTLDAGRNTVRVLAATDADTLAATGVTAAIRGVSYVD